MYCFSIIMMNFKFYKTNMHWKKHGTRGKVRVRGLCSTLLYVRDLSRARVSSDCSAGWLRFGRARTPATWPVASCSFNWNTSSQLENLRHARGVHVHAFHVAARPGRHACVQSTVRWSTAKRARRWWCFVPLLCHPPHPRRELVCTVRDR